MEKKRRIIIASCIVIASCCICCASALGGVLVGMRVKEKRETENGQYAVYKPDIELAGSINSSNEEKYYVYIITNFNNVDLYLEGTGTVYDISNNILTGWRIDRSLIKSYDFGFVPLHWSEFEPTAYKITFAVNWVGSNLSTNYDAFKSFELDRGWLNN